MARSSAGAAPRRRSRRRRRSTGRPWRRSARRATSRAIAPRSTGSGGAPSVDPRASATTSSTSPTSSSVSACRSSMILARVSASRSGWRRSTARFVRTLVSGVRSSCPASSTSRRWSSRDAASAPSIPLKAAPRRPTSSLPPTGTSTSRRPELLHVGGRPGEAGERPRHGAGDQPAERGGGRRHQHHEQHRLRLEVVEDAAFSSSGRPTCSTAPDRLPGGHAAHQPEVGVPCVDDVVVQRSRDRCAPWPGRGRARRRRRPGTTRPGGRSGTTTWTTYTLSSSALPR